MENKNPLSPHIQIYNWHISSLVSISHRVTGIINFFTITLIGLWIASLLLGEQNYVFISLFLTSFFGKFACLGIIWSFTFQIFSEIRHLIMDLGYGFEQKTTQISGLIVLIGPFPTTILIFLIGQHLL
jgi:succinate dehydrogenase / fumarate reductase cytochrome b subunit